MIRWIGIPMTIVLTLSSGFQISNQHTLSSTTAKAVIYKGTEPLQHFDQSVTLPAINARVDRVWRAIPGLCGLQQYGKLHLVWRQIPPRVRLADLPAEPIYRGPSEEKSVSLMINVSWGEEYIPSLLEILKNSSAHATFFLDGAWVKKHPELAKRIAAEGHAIGSHGTGHPDFRKLTASKLEEQVSGTNQIIEQTVGKRPLLLAPPAGSFDQRVVKIAHLHHMYTILWTADTIDWRRPPATTIVTRAVKGSEPGALILMHPTAPTVKALPLILRNLKKMGYSFKTVTDVVEEKRKI